MKPPDPGHFHAASRPRPELLSPAGDFECARAAVENGADAVYFGLRLGMNARARAKNFSPEELLDLMAYLRLRGVQGYVTLNTLVFPDEWRQFEEAVRLAVSAGVDAVLVQDLGAARLIRALCPDWPLHASTQMSLSSAEGIRAAQSLGIERVVLARELSLDEIRRIRGETAVKLEVFVHGALCISYSGQCLASLAMGGRSGNRGQCAQPCRLPYRFAGHVSQAPSATPSSPADNRQSYSAAELDYPLSPNDLCALNLVPELIAARVDALKIEGRLKSAEYVAAVTRQYRRAIDEALAGRTVEPTPADIAELEVSFSRGFSQGWLKGRDSRLVSGQGSAKRGVLVGTVRALRGDRVVVELSGSIQRGDGVVFEPGRGRSQKQGGRVYDVVPLREPSAGAPLLGENVELSFARDAIDVTKLRPGLNVWKTDDPRISARLRKTYLSTRPQRRVPLDLSVEATIGSRLAVSARAASGAACRVESSDVLQEARKHPVTVELLREQFGRLGTTVYALRDLQARIEGRPMVPLSVLGSLRHELVQCLDAAALCASPLALAQVSPLDVLRATGARGGPMAPSCTKRGPEVRHVLCRSLEQLPWALDAGACNLIAELDTLDEYAKAVQLARKAGVKILLAAPRIQKPSDMQILEHMLSCRPDGMVARNLASAAYFSRHALPFVADFSLNATNELSVAHLRSLGALRVTPAYDLNGRQLLQLAALVEPDTLEVIVHAHVPMFHTEHVLRKADHEPGSGKRRTSPPLLRDRRGVEHPLHFDICGRTTLYHGKARDITPLMPTLSAIGVRHFRLELLAGLSQHAVRPLLDRYLGAQP